jgi:hypothetical protein
LYENFSTYATAGDAAALVGDLDANILGTLRDDYADVGRVPVAVLNCV